MKVSLLRIVYALPIQLHEWFICVSDTSKTSTVTVAYPDNYYEMQAERKRENMLDTVMKRLQKTELTQFSPV